MLHSVRTERRGGEEGEEEMHVDSSELQGEAIVTVDVERWSSGGMRRRRKGTRGWRQGISRM